MYCWVIELYDKHQDASLIKHSYLFQAVSSNPLTTAATLKAIFVRKQQPVELHQRTTEYKDSMHGVQPDLHVSIWEPAVGWELPSRVSEFEDTLGFRLSLWCGDDEYGH